MLARDTKREISAEVKVSIPRNHHKSPFFSCWKGVKLSSSSPQALPWERESEQLSSFAVCWLDDNNLPPPTFIVIDDIVSSCYQNIHPHSPFSHSSHHEFSPPQRTFHSTHRKEALESYWRGRKLKYVYVESMLWIWIWSSSSLLCYYGLLLQSTIALCAFNRVVWSMFCGI